MAVMLLDLETDRVEVHRRPAADGHAGARVLTRGHEVAPEALPDLRATVGELLG